MAPWRHSVAAVLPLLISLTAALRMAPQHPDDLDPWTYHLEDTRIPLPRYRQGDESCKHFRAGEEESGRVPEWLRWHFAPPRSSEWLQFNASQLCSALSAKAANHSNPRMLFVGDSMSQAQFESLLFLLGDAEKFDLSPMATVKGRDPHVSKQDFAPAETRRDHGSKNGGALACGGKLWIQQQGTMNGYIDYSTDFAIPNHTDWVQSFDVLVVMLPWSTEDWRTQKGIDFWLSSLLPHQQLIIRPATIGHEHTGALYNHSWRDDDVDAVFAKRPHRSPLKTPAEVVNYFGRMMGHISWQKHRESHERILADVRQNHTGVSILDVFYLTSMMWDRHRDPLHYCHPGPIDTWNEILFNLLVRGHLRDYDEWESAFAKEVVRLGGLRNSAGVPFEQ